MADISADDLLAAYDRHARASSIDLRKSALRQQDLLVIRAWNGLSGAGLEDALGQCSKVAHKHGGGHVELAGGAAQWTQNLRELVSDPVRMRKLADESARKMKLAGVPVQDFFQPAT